MTAIREPAGPVAERISELWTWLLVVGAAVWVLVVVLLVVAIVRRRHAAVEGAALPEARPPVPERTASRWIVAGGVLLPGVVLVWALALSVATMRAIPHEPLPGSLAIEVIGYQFAWEVRYPEEGVTLDNEIHVPVGRPVALTLRSTDVIHSFWVPELAGKIDVLPDYATTLQFQADEPGEFTGQCAEFCGLHHATMRIVVVAHPPEEYEAWVEEQQAA